MDGINRLGKITIQLHEMQREVEIGGLWADYAIAPDDCGYLLDLIRRMSLLLEIHDTAEQTDWKNEVSAILSEVGDES